LLNTEAAEPARPAELVARASDHIREAKSDETRTAYGLAWRQLTSWCETHGRRALPMVVTVFMLAPPNRGRLIGNHFRGAIRAEEPYTALQADAARCRRG
jgi:hypothetical protein